MVKAVIIGAVSLLLLCATAAVSYLLGEVKGFGNAYRLLRGGGTTGKEACDGTQDNG